MFIGLDFKSCFDLDIIEKVDLIEKPPTEEVVTREELTELFNESRQVLSVSKKRLSQFLLGKNKSRVLFS